MRQDVLQSERWTTYRNEWPSWLSELDLSLAAHSHIVLSGNIRDVFLIDGENGVALESILGSLWRLLSRRGVQFLLVYDPVDGVRVFPPEARTLASRLNGVKLADADHTPVSLTKLADWLRIMACARDVPCAFVIDYASRLPDVASDVAAFFAACEKLARETPALRPPKKEGHPPFNHVIWLINRPSDLPDWFVVGNEAIRTVVVGMPDRQSRAVAANKLSGSFPQTPNLAEEQRRALVGSFADLTDGLTLRGVIAVSQLARDQGMPLSQIGEAIRCYKVGIRDNPWKKDYLKDKIRNGKDFISKQVLGQVDAVQKALDILTRSVMGLSGAQAHVQGSRPRGVLFFAGPTGVGKTELAKSITRLIFGDDQAYIRFDMSEFSSEHSDARLIGAPPGYLGYDAGGELVNAIRQRPFSVVLFDEIEKAHPRILDKFLQILEDGRLTDGRGDTVFFSEAVIIFTSNLGIYVENNEGQRKLNVSSDAPFHEVEQRIRCAIEQHFRFNLQRPELLNRIGDNVVVFDFIRSDVAAKIFDRMLQNVLRRVLDEHSVTINLEPSVRVTLLDLCTRDLVHGGRGIGNRLESTFINPLARALFDSPLAPGRSLNVTEVRADGTNYCLELS